jgi:hypothetical protein
LPPSVELFMLRKPSFSYSSFANEKRTLGIKTTV